MPPDTKPPQQDPVPQDPKPSQPTMPTLPPGGLNFNTPLFNGELSGSVTQPSPTQYQGNATYLFKNGDTLGANALIGTNPFLIEQYGLNGTFGIGGGGTAKFGFDALPPKDTYKWLTDIKFGDGSLFNAELNKSPQGDIFKTGGLWKFDKESQLTAAAEFNGVEKFKDFKLGGSFNNDNHAFNLGYKDTLAGAIFKGDGKTTVSPGSTLTGGFEFNDVEKFKDFKLGGNFNDKHAFNLGYKDTLGGTIFNGDGKTTLSPGNTLSGAFEFNGVEKFNQFKLGGNFNEKHTFNFDFKDSPSGSIFKGDGKTTLRPGNTLTGGFEFNDLEKFKDFKLGGNFSEKHAFNLNYKDSPGGSIFKADGKTTFSSGDVLAGSVQVNNVEKFKEYTLGYSTLGGNKLDLGFKNLEAGNIFNADGKLMLNTKDYLTGSVLLNGVEKTNEFKLGANIKDNLYNFNLSTSPLGTTLGAGAKFGFDDGKGSVSLDGKFGPKLSEMMGSIAYKAKDLEYSGNIKFNNETGSFGLAELGVKLSKGDERFKYNLEANVNPHTGDYKVMAGISISFGGGSRRMSAPETPTSADRAVDPVADFKQKQFVAFDKQAIDRLNPNDRALYDQAKVGVEKLNASGANLDVDKTAMYLAALGNEKGFTKIEKVEFGNKTSDGRQNLFIFDREPTNPLVKAVPADPAVASNTPVRASADLLNKTPDVVDAKTGVVKAEPQAVANPEVATAKRGH